ncbi:MAG: nucleotidyltransferase domain-containing protein [Candidatus Methanoperedens sp.]|nr:nucleotidyltransferase domain-containing protein [Candidatus Methanoperedens sp.]
MQTKLITELTAVLKQKFSQSLLSIVLFGSIVKGNFTETSDIDVIVVCENLIEDWRARDKMILELTEDIELKYSTPIHMNLVGKDEISHSIESANPLLLEIYDANRIIYDKGSFFSNLLKNFEFNLHKWHATKIEKGFWKIPGLAVIESA